MMQRPTPPPDPPRHTPRGLPGDTDLVVYVDADGKQHGPMPSGDWEAYAAANGLGPTPVTHEIDGVQSALLTDRPE